MRKRSIRLTAGLLAVFVGLMLLLLTNGVVRAGELFVLALLLVAGVVAVIHAFLEDGRDAQFLGGTILVLLVLFLTMRATVFGRAPIARVWPGFVTIGGVSLLAYGLKKGSDYRLALGVPALFIVALSGVFFLFSLDVVRTTFVDFVITWWPTLIVAGGILTVWRHGSDGSSESSEPLE